MTDSTVPTKPRKDYPLTPRGDGRWQKKVRGKVYYFRGTAAEALDEWLRIKDDLYAGHDPRPASDELTVKELANLFYDDAKMRVETGELSAKALSDYKAALAHVVEVFGRTRLVRTLTVQDFKKLRAHLAKGRSLVTLKNLIVRIRVAFQWAVDTEYLDAPLRGIKKGLARPNATALDKERAERGEVDFSREEIIAFLDAADQQMKPLILLGINTGIGNCDVARLESRHIKGDVMNYPRGKNGHKRRAVLWPETLQAIADAGGLPLRCSGEPWWTESNARLSTHFRRLLNSIGDYGERRGFYDFRRTFRTIADETQDFPAVNLAMGHVDSSMGATYRQRISDERLRKVAEHVHRWLWPPEEQEAGKRRQSRKRRPNSPSPDSRW